MWQLRGPVIGKFADKPIYGFIMFNGVTLYFDGLALKNRQGDVDISRLEGGQCVIAPGLLYAPGIPREKVVRMHLFQGNDTMNLTDYSLDEGLNSTSNEGDFDAWCTLLLAYKRDIGDCAVTDKFVMGEFRLGTWCTRQRTAKAGQHLSQSRIDKLDAIGFVWSLRDHRFETGLTLLRAYRDQQGHCNVPHDYVVSGFALGYWCSARRHEQRFGTLLAERVRSMDALGFVWDVTIGQFELGFGKLQDYWREHGNCRMPRNKVINGFHLGRWCHDRRREYKLGRLPGDRVGRLEKIGFLWDLRPTPREVDRQLERAAPAQYYRSAHPSACKSSLL